uniref:LO4 n=1 Tax=Brook salamander adomavirus TaxID=2609872 RepID=A0A6F9EY51_9VIRU|nr:TPA_asm: LO4 [Brook salamander adomavirus]
MSEINKMNETLNKALSNIQSVAVHYEPPRGDR